VLVNVYFRLKDLLSLGCELNLFCIDLFFVHLDCALLLLNVLLIVLLPVNFKS